MRRAALASLGLALLGGCATARLPLRSVVLYQNGLGYFEREGHLAGDRLRLRLRRDEVDDILKSLTVLGAGDRQTVGSVASLKARGDEGDHDLELALPDGASRDLRVTYAAPTPVWRAAYRVVLGDQDGALVQGWAIVANPSHEDWEGVQLTLATGAPLSFQVDLHTPRSVDRPDATGRFTHAVATGVVGSESAEKATGVDTDGDRIPDVEDKCPSEPETYNGFEDEDGCPDKGRVIIRKASIEILDKIYFQAGSAEIKVISRPILDAVAATMTGNPAIKLMEIQGHAAPGEPGGMALSERRAQAVRGYLVGKGVAASRLSAQGYGATHPARTSGPDAAAVNRRVEFLILRRDQEDKEAEEGEHAPATIRARVPRPTLEHMERSVAVSPATRVDVAGMSRFQLKTPITIRHGTSAMITILNERVLGEEIYLYRPDPGAPGSALHPFRAARVAGPKGTTLEPGPAAIYARGTFVGDAVLDRLDAGQTTFLPFAVDSSTTVHREDEDGRTPVRLVTIARGVAVVEDRAFRKTRYEVRAGADVPRRIFVRHPRASGYELVTKPDGLQETADAALLPLSLKAGATTTLVIEERSPARRSVELARADHVDLRAYVNGSTLPADLRQALEDCLALREKLATLEAEEALTRRRSDDAAERQQQLRDNLTAIAKNPRAEALRKELLARLTEAVKAGNDLSARLARLTSDHAEARARLEARVRDLSLDDKPAGK